MSYYGKYRAIVVDVDDPEKRGRIKVTCPKVFGEGKSPWCQPCVPYAYDNGGDFVLPKLNDFVWVEFEDGDVRYPIYTGGLWAKEKSPVTDYKKAKDTRQIEFAGGKIVMTKDNIVVSLGSSKITMTSSSISLSAGTINLN